MLFFRVVVVVVVVVDLAEFLVPRSSVGGRHRDYFGDSWREVNFSSRYGTGKSAEEIVSEENRAVVKRVHRRAAAMVVGENKTYTKRTHHLPKKHSVPRDKRRAQQQHGDTQQQQQRQCKNSEREKGS